MDWPAGEGEMVRRVRGLDWGATALGPASGWPQSLRTVTELVLGSVVPMAALWGPEFVLIYNDAFSPIMGDRHPAGLGLPARLCWPDHWPVRRRRYAIVMGGGSPPPEERLCPVERHGVREEAWFTIWLSGLRNEAGALSGVLVTGVETTSSRRGAAALKRSEQGLRIALEAGRMGTWRYNLMTGAQEWDARQYALLGIDPGVQPSRELFMSIIVPEDRPLVEIDPAALDEPGRFLDSEFRIRRPDGEVRWITAHSLARFDSSGAPVEIVGVNWDNTDQKRAYEAVQVMMAELQHRTRNLIGVVQSIARQTIGESETLDDFRQSFTGRLMALARVQGLLSRAEVERITIGAIVEMELEALGIDERVSVSGPEVPLQRAVVQTLLLALHELATNARKHGALSSEGGRVAIRWEKQRAEAHRESLFVEWHETGIAHMEGPIAAADGYGRVLIEKALPYSFGAETSFTLADGELRCTIELPLDGTGKA